MAGRYALKERRATLGVIEVWLATDSTLEREVSVTIFPTKYDRAEAILDAARRSAVVNDHRLVRVLDVGSRGEVSWLVEESLSESTSIAELLQQGPLPPEEARRIAGETASALEVARRHGLHHLHLTPHAVRRTNAGLIKVAGLSTAAAVEGTEALEPDEADRTDTIAIVALLYAAMTTRWPLKTPVPGLQPAPRIVAGVAPPSEIAVAVPGDLDALCRATFTTGAGPRTPQEAISALSPWSHTLVKHVSPKPAAAAGLTQEIPRVAAGTAAGAGTTRRAQPTAAPERRPSHREMRAHERAAKAAETRREIAARRRDPGYLDLPEALAESSGPAEPPAPLLAAAPLETEGAHSKLVLAIVLGVLLLAMAFAIPSLTTALSSATSPRATGKPTTSASSPAGSPATTTSSAPATSATTTGPAIELTGARALDPGGDGKENNGQAARAIDGNPETMWQSEGYKAADFQGQKDGVGIAFTIPEDATPTKVSLTFPDVPQNAEVYLGPKRSKEGATLAGQVSDATGAANIDVPADAANDARYLIVWFPQAAKDGDGKFRASLADVSAS